MLFPIKNFLLCNLFKLAVGATWKGQCRRTVLHSLYRKSWPKLHWRWIKASLFCVSCSLLLLSCWWTCLGPLVLLFRLDQCWASWFFLYLDRAMFSMYLVFIIKLNVFNPCFPDMLDSTWSKCALEEECQLHLLILRLVTVLAGNRWCHC